MHLDAFGCIPIHLDAFGRVRMLSEIFEIFSKILVVCREAELGFNGARISETPVGVEVSMAGEAVIK